MLNRFRPFLRIMRYALDGSSPGSGGPHWGRDVPGPGRGPRPAEISPPGALAPVGPHRLHYRCDGVGTPAVVLEAGIAASSLSWSRLQPLLARSTRVCSYDRAGLAWSDATSSPRSITALVDELRRMLSAPGSRRHMYSSGTRSAGSSSAASRARIRQTSRDSCSSIPCIRKNGASRRSISAACFAMAFSVEAGSAARAPRRSASLPGAARAAVLRQRHASSAGYSAGPPRALLQHMVGEVQKLPAEVLPAVQAHWSNPKPSAACGSILRDARVQRRSRTRRR